MSTLPGLVNRAKSNAVALETTLLCHGVPSASAPVLARELDEIVIRHGASPALVGIVDGTPTVGLTDEELAAMLAAESVVKVNTANIGVAMHRGSHAATTVATTMELAALAGIRVFATGGIGGVHREYGEHLDISSDLAAFTRFPVAVVTSGVKNLLDVVSTREALETLGVPVVGFQTDTFPAFYLRDGRCSVDARFDSATDLADFVSFEMNRTGRGVVIANPIPTESELDAHEWNGWLEAALTQAKAEGCVGRAVTPRVLGLVHDLSNGQTLEANIALVKSNAALAAQIAAQIAQSRT